MSFILLCILVYPTAPFLYDLTKSAAFQILIFLIIIIKYACNYKKKIVLNNFPYLMTLVVLLLNLLFFKENIFNIREILFILFISTFQFINKELEYNLIIKDVFMILFAFLFSAFLFLVIYYYLGLINYNDFAVNKLNLEKSNPILSRQEGGDFDYFLINKILVIPYTTDKFEIFGFKYLRQSFIFLEPFFLNNILVPFALLFFYIKQSMKYIHYLLFILFVLIVGISIWTLISMFIVGTVIYLNNKFKFGKLFFLAVTFLLIYSFSFEFYSSIINYISPEKSLQLLKLSNKMSLDNITYFGSSFLDESTYITYGASINIVRYGLVGIIFYFSIWAHLLNKFLSFSTRYYVVSFAGIISLLLSLKMPQFTLLITLFIYNYILFLNKSKSDNKNVQFSFQ